MQMPGIQRLNRTMLEDSFGFVCSMPRLKGSLKVDISGHWHSLQARGFEYLLAVAGPCPPLSSLGSPSLAVEIGQEPEIFAEHLGRHPRREAGGLPSSCNTRIAFIALVCLPSASSVCGLQAYTLQDMQGVLKEIKKFNSKNLWRGRKKMQKPHLPHASRWKQAAPYQFTFNMSISLLL